MSGMYAFPARLVRSLVSKFVPITSALIRMSVPGISAAACAMRDGLAARFQYHMTSSAGSSEMLGSEPQPDGRRGSAPAVAISDLRDGRCRGGSDRVDRRKARALIRTPPRRVVTVTRERSRVTQIMTPRSRVVNTPAPIGGSGGAERVGLCPRADAAPGLCGTFPPGSVSASRERSRIFLITASEGRRRLYEHPFLSVPLGRAGPWLHRPPLRLPDLLLAGGGARRRRQQLCRAGPGLRGRVRAGRTGPRGRLRAGPGLRA